MQTLLVGTPGPLARKLAKDFSARGETLLNVADLDKAIGLLSLADIVVLDCGTTAEELLFASRQIRAANDVPIVVATDDPALGKRLVRADQGVESYLLKPCDLTWLLALLHTVRERHLDGPTKPLLRFIRVDDLVLDTARRTVTVAGEPVDLSGKEFDVLAVIAAARGAVVGRARLIRAVWRCYDPSISRSLNVHINRVRAKLGRPGMVRTVHRVGYRLATAGQEPVANPVGVHRSATPLVDVPEVKAS